MATDKDIEQDELIRENTENIRRNQEAIARQTAALEKIRDHYFPKKTWWKRLSGGFLKLVGAVTLVAGVMEAFEWYLNSQLMSGMADESATVARRLFLKENDVAGAVKFLEKAVELHGGSAKYRIKLAYVKGMAAVSRFYDLGRPLTAEERTTLDEILSEAVFLQQMEPEAAMPQVLAAQVYGLRGEKAAALAAADKAVELEPDNVQAHVTACAQHFTFGDVAEARRQLAEADRIDPQFPLVMFWKAFFALEVDHDPDAALTQAKALVERSPKFVQADLLMGRLLMAGKKPDLPAARAMFAKALAAVPGLVPAMVLAAETYELEGNSTMARIWLDKAVKTDSKNMKALIARARLRTKSGECQTALDDLAAAIDLAPFRADLYLERAKAQEAAGDTAAAAKSRKTAADIQTGTAVNDRACRPATAAK